MLCVAAMSFHSLSTALRPRRAERLVPRVCFGCSEVGAVVWGGDELPFAIDRAEAAAGEASDAAVVFGLSEDGLDRRASFLVEPSSAWCGELGDHCDRGGWRRSAPAGQ